VNRARYQDYVDLRANLSVHAIDKRVIAVLTDLAEARLLARDRAEATAARDRVAPALETLVEQGDLSGHAARRIWKGMRGCGPPLPWPPSWDRRSVSRRRALRRQSG
jgi:hypothetical protein